MGPGDLVLEQVGVADDRVEWRAQLVRHRRHELRFGFVGLNRRLEPDSLLLDRSNLADGFDGDRNDARHQRRGDDRCNCRRRLGHAAEPEGRLPQRHDLDEMREGTSDEEHAEGDEHGAERNLAPRFDP
jgi:hypothetical protein